MLCPYMGTHWLAPGRHLLPMSSTKRANSAISTLKKHTEGGEMNRPNPIGADLRRKREARHRFAWMVATVAIGVVGAASGQDAVRPPGELVDVGGYRIHLWCTGPKSSGPTIVLSSGGGGYALDWALVQPAIAETRRVCSYDRPNFGFSDLGPTPRSLTQEAFELHATLTRAGEQGPYVLVGQSIGGALVRFFVRAYQQEVVGIVLVDALHESARLGYKGEFVAPRTRATDRQVPAPRGLQESPPVLLTGDAAERCRSGASSAQVYGPYLKLPDAVQRMLLWILQHPKCFEYSDDYLAEELALLFREREENPQPLGALPLVVLHAAASELPPGVDEAEWRKERLDQQTDLARLSSNGRLIADPTSGHFIHFDNPSLVISAILDVVDRSTSD
jgi:pimeloyl-ACP methyl ester carboxylesterase